MPTTKGSPEYQKTSEREGVAGMESGYEKERLGRSGSGLSFDRGSLAIVLAVLVVLLAYNYKLISNPEQGTQGNGLLGVINESNVLIYIIVLIAGAVLFVRMNRISLTERIKMNNPTLLAILASFFIFASIYYFIAGFHDTVIAPQYSAGKDFRQTYGWLLEFFVYLFIAALLVYASRRLKSRPDVNHFARTYPHGVLLAIFTLVIIFIGATIAGMGEQNVSLEIGSLQNIFTLLIFGGLAYFFVWTVETIVRKQGLTREAAAPAVIALGVCCVAISVVSYTATTVEYTKGTLGLMDLAIGLAGPIILGVIGTLLLIMATFVFKSGVMEEEAVYTSIFVLGTFYILLAIIQLFMGFDEFISSAEPNSRWVLAVLLFLVPGVIANALAPFLRERGMEYFERFAKGKSS
jgi:hypothetical protein